MSKGDKKLGQALADNFKEYEGRTQYVFAPSMVIYLPDDVSASKFGTIEYPDNEEDPVHKMLDALVEHLNELGGSAMGRFSLVKRKYDVQRNEC